MTYYLQVGFLLSFVIMAMLFIAAMWRSPSRAKWLGVVLLAASAPFFFWVGAFSEQFGAALCYSESMDMIANAVEKTEDPIELSKKIRALPMRGYETECTDLEAAAKGLPHALPLTTQSR